LRMRAPEEKPSGSRHFRSPYRSCTLVVVQNVSVAHAHAITSGSTSAQHLRKWGFVRAHILLTMISYIKIRLIFVKQRSRARTKPHLRRCCAEVLPEVIACACATDTFCTTTNVHDR
jgi:hypothetical protein